MAILNSPTLSSSSSLSTLRKLPFFSFPRKSSTHLSLPFTHISKPHQHKPLKTLAPTRPLRSAAVSDLSASTSAAPQSLKSRLRNGDTLYGLFLLTFSPTLAEIAGLAGYDFVVVDMEHGPGGIPEALTCLRALAATRTPAIIRLPESSPAWAKKALDIGPQGIMFPMIDTPKLARKAVSYCRFPPNGIRGSAHTVVRASNYGIDAGYLSNYEEDLLIMCQVESVEGVEKIEEIAAVDGVDCIQMGPLDLSASVGYLWDPGHKKVREVMRKAEKAVLAKNSGAYLAGFAMPHDRPEDLRLRGYHMVSGAVDTGMFRSAAVQDVNKFKTILAAEDDGEEDRKDGDADDKYWSE